MSTIRENQPSADILMTSMRSMGYTFESAIADIVDNSISAQASHIEIHFPSNPNSCFVAICDNGCGMSRDELFDAMKYGSRLKGQERTEEDLGRFGLGMKAASLSQCRKLTVISRKDKTDSGFIWDLDVIEQEKNWAIIELDSEEINSLSFHEYFNYHESGTVVIWENFDFIEKSSGDVYAELTRLSESVTKYTELIFHRFLTRRQNPVIMHVDEYQLTARDPFLENHPKTNVRRRIFLPVNDSNGQERYISAQPYILPYQKDMTRDDLELVGGADNLRNEQGYYIYRNERLIVWGSWFGRPKGELTKHARVKVDIPNALDDIWGIDIKKQSAKIPKVIRQRLTKAVDEAMDIAVKAQTYRGRVEKVNTAIDYIWERIHERDNQYSYRINRSSRVFQVLENVDGETWKAIDMVLDEIERCIPFQQIYVDRSQNCVLDAVDEDRLQEIEARAFMLARRAVRKDGVSFEEALEDVFRSEPFFEYPDMKTKLLEGCEQDVGCK